MKRLALAAITFAGYYLLVCLYMFAMILVMWAACKSAHFITLWSP